MRRRALLVTFVSLVAALAVGCRGSDGEADAFPLRPSGETLLTTPSQGFPGTKLYFAGFAPSRCEVIEASLVTLEEHASAPDHPQGLVSARVEPSEDGRYRGTLVVPHVEMRGEGARDLTVHVDCIVAGRYSRGWGAKFTVLARDG